MKYQHIVFDVDGTLVDNAYAILRSLQETIREFTGKTYPMEELTFCLGIPRRGHPEAAGDPGYQRSI